VVSCGRNGLAKLVWLTATASASLKALAAPGASPREKKGGAETMAIISQGDIGTRHGVDPVAARACATTTPQWRNCCPTSGGRNARVCPRNHRGHHDRCVSIASALVVPM